MSYEKFLGSKITQKGTELPLLNLKGKPYLQVAHRLVWFREEQPLAEIKTQALSLTDTSAVFKAEVIIDGKVVGSGHKKETEDNFPDFIEKAETGAIGRALAMAGFGTQFEPELDEGDRLADAPIEAARKLDKAVAKKMDDSGPTSPKPGPGGSGGAANHALAPKSEPKGYNASTIEEAVRTQASKLMTSKKMTSEQISALIKQTYGAEKIKDLPEDKMKDLLLNLQQLNK